MRSVLAPAVLSALTLVCAATRSEAQLTEQARLFASDGQAQDALGYGGAIAGDTVVIGAYRDDDAGNNSGSAYVYVDSGTGWSEQAKLTASDAAANDWFGYQVGLDGDTLVVGAVGSLTSALTPSGAAYVFVRNAGVWTEQAKLIAADAGAADEFGVAVAIVGDTAVVGSWHDNNAGGTDAGSAYVFVRSGGVWTQQAKLRASDGATFDEFGAWVSLSEDANTVIAGAPGDDHSAKANAGSAYVFVRSGATWTEQAKLTASDAAPGDWLASAAVSGDTAVVGAQTADTGAGVDAGAAYVFRRTGGVWTEEAKLEPADAAAGDRFGVFTAILGERVLVGAPLADVAALTDAGAAYVFTRSGAVWSETEKLVASDGEAGDRLGICVALAGDSALVGADHDDVGTEANAGSGYVFCLSEATATLRNSGANPVSYTCGAPELGVTFLASVDLSTSGHAFARLVAYSAPADIALAGGQRLLCGGARLGSTPLVPGPLASFALPLPASTSLCGLALTTQAVHLGTVMPFALSNAQDLVLGH